MGATRGVFEENQQKRSSTHLRPLSVPDMRRAIPRLLPLLIRAAAAQTFVGGDLSSQPRPYGVSFQSFANAAVSNVSFPIAGYNTSQPAGPVVATSSQLPGWAVDIAVSVVVPLPSSDSSSTGGNLYFEATTLSLAPPAGLGAGYDSSNWCVCAIVFTGGLTSGESAVLDGSCGSLLPSDCISQLQASSVATNASGEVSGCEDLGVPARCGVVIVRQGPPAGVTATSVAVGAGVSVWSFLLPCLIALL